ncbi:MAG: hypothetical protein ACI9LZ_003993, partial [Glaciecola sp.]
NLEYRFCQRPMGNHCLLGALLEKNILLFRPTPCFSTELTHCRLSLQARAIHPVGVEADIQATPKLGLALRCRKSALSPN